MLPIEKYCNKCDTTKPASDFRVRTDKRYGYVFLNTTCRECDAAYSREYHNARKDDPEYKKKNSKNATDSAKRTGANKRRWEKNKNDPEYKAALKKWRADNHERNAAKQKMRSKKHSDKERESVGDGYVISVICSKQPEITASVLRSQPELIELKRAEILNHRITKKIKHYAKKQII